MYKILHLTIVNIILVPYEDFLHHSIIESSDNIYNDSPFNDTTEIVIVYLNTFLQANNLNITMLHPDLKKKNIN